MQVMLRVLEDMFRENGEAGVAVTDLMDRVSTYSQLKTALSYHESEVQKLVGCSI